MMNACYLRLKGKGNWLTVRVPTMLYVPGDGPRGTQVYPVYVPPLGSILPPTWKVDHVERRYVLYERHLWDPLFQLDMIIMHVTQPSG